GRSQYAGPKSANQTWKTALGCRENIGQHADPLFPGDRYHVELSALRQWKDDGAALEVQLHLAGKQVGDCCSRAPVRHMRDFDLRQQLEQFPQQMRLGPVTRRSEADPPRITSGMRHNVLN